MTKTRWAELTGKQQWDLQVALRGPDCQFSEPIKWLTTSVLRWAMHTVMRVGGTLNEDLKIIIVPDNPHKIDQDIRGRVGEERVFAWSPSHFFNHVREAAEVCSIPVFGVPNKPYFEAVGYGQPPLVCARLWKFAHDNPAFGGQLEAELARHINSMWGHDDPAKFLESLELMYTPKPKKISLNELKEKVYWQTSTGAPPCPE